MSGALSGRRGAERGSVVGASGQVHCKGWRWESEGAEEEEQETEE